MCCRNEQLEAGIPCSAGLKNTLVSKTNMEKESRQLRQSTSPIKNFPFQIVSSCLVYQSTIQVS